MRATRWVTIGLVVLALPLAVGFAADYIGAAKCKMCHKVEYTSWESLSHAKAFDRLKDDEKANPECLKCHATGGTAELPGVQCEACHGAGSEYKSMKIMKDHEASVAAGLIKPGPEMCRGCHEKAPHEVPPFDYEAMKTKGVHEFKKKTE